MKESESRRSKKRNSAHEVYEELYRANPAIRLAVESGQLAKLASVNEQDETVSTASPRN